MAIQTPYIELTSLDIDNHVINGALNFWQRTTSFTANAVSQSIGLTADRLQNAAGGTVTNKHYSIVQDVDVPTVLQANYTFPYSYTFTCLTGTSFVSDDIVWPLLYRLEGPDYNNLHSKTATLSFWVKSNQTGTYSAAFNTLSYTRAYVTTFTIHAQNTWEQKFITITFENAGAYPLGIGQLGLEISIGQCGGSGFTQTSLNQWITVPGVTGYIASGSANIMSTTSNYMKIAGIKVNLGAAASPFTLAGRTIGQEFVRCQRYFCWSSLWWVNFGAQSDFVGRFPTQMMGNPTAYVLNGNLNYNILGISAGTCVYQSTIGTSPTGGIIRCTSFTGGAGSLLAITSADEGHIGWQAEL